jgi:hypothetical protein
MTPGRLQHLRQLANYVTYVGAGQSPDAHNDMLELCDAAAAAPELLDAARLALDAIGNTRDELGLKIEAEKAYLALAAAIAKAEGR